MKNNHNEESIINQHIKYPRVRLIDVSGKQIGVYSSNEALSIAIDQGLDLVVISNRSEPPVCKIIDYGKYRFTQEKKAKEAKKKQHHTSVKEVKMRYKIESHDYRVRINQAIRFLKSGDKVKITVIFRGREVQHFNLAIELLKKISNDLREISQVQQQPLKDGKNITMILSPNRK